ncbi:MAG TPA: AI-2E family transporter [Gemmatimonadales bacterium]|nr:AI-2E family transporter [Gemmatimonadales bacterium]
MALLETRRERAAFLVMLLAGALIFALFPYASGLIGIPVLYAVFAPFHDRLAKHLHTRLAATIVVLVALVAIAVPAVMLAGLLVSEAQQIASDFLQSPLLVRIAELKLGPLELGSRIASLGETLVSWLGMNAFGLLGTATRLALNLLVALFGLFYLLLRPGETWTAVAPYIPFSAKNTEILRARFSDVTTSTVIGTGFSAAVHGTLVGLAFKAAGLPDALFWSVVTAAVSILPVLGSAMVWGPGGIALVLEGRVSAGIALLVWGIVVVGNVDYVIRPFVFKRWAHIHPLVTLVGALAGVPHFGILGLLIGPLAVSYLFELIRMYQEEYLAAPADET